MFGCSGALTVHHNRLTDNGLDGIFVQNCAAEIRNNTVRNPGTDGRGITLFQATGAVATRNIDLQVSTGFTITRNNASRNTTVGCRWDGGGTQTFVANSCKIEVPAGAWV